MGLAHELPGDPPAGEHVLWQGAPDWWLLAKSLRIRPIAAWLAASFAWYVADALRHLPVQAALPGILRMAGLTLAGIAVIAAYAWLVCRGTSYTLTNRRIVLQIGLALPISFNIPFARILNVAVKLQPDRSGDLALSLEPGGKLSALVMWPHVRPWRLGRAEPMLRALPDAEAVAGRLAQLLASGVVTEREVPQQAAAEMPASVFDHGFSAAA